MDVGDEVLRHTRRRCTDALPLEQGAVRGFVVVHTYGAVEFIRDIHMPAARLERDVSWACARPRIDVRVRAELAGGRIEIVNQELIHPQIGYDRESAIWCQRSRA